MKLDKDPLAMDNDISETEDNSARYVKSDGDPLAIENEIVNNIGQSSVQQMVPELPVVIKNEIIDEIEEEFRPYECFVKTEDDNFDETIGKVEFDKTGDESAAHFKSYECDNVRNLKFYFMNF